MTDSDLVAEPPVTEPPAGREVAAGSLLQQAAQAAGLLALLAIVTVLARRLPVPELGTYGLLASLGGYLMVIRNSVASSAVRAMASAAGDAERAASFSTAVALYAAAALATGVLVAGAGALVAAVVLDGDLRGQAQLGAAVLGAVMAAAILSGVYLDALRASLLLRRSAATELAGVALFATAMLTAIAADAPLWALIGLSGSVTLMSGLLAAVSVRALALPYRFRRDRVTRERAAQLLPTAGHLLTIELSTLVIYGLDRVILGAYRGPGAVGLYEGPVRAHNVFFALGGAFGVTTLPTASRYHSDRDGERLRALLVRGSRYTLALTVPLAVAAIALAAPLLAAWLGDEYRDGAAALSILVSYWLLYGALAVTPGFLVGLGRARQAARCIAAVAALNLALSIALTPLLGLEGPALGTAIPYALAFPILLRLGLRATGARLADLAREAWLPAYALGAALAAGLLAARFGLGLESPGAVVALAVGGCVLYWAAFYALVLRPDERLLVRDVLRSVVPGRAARPR